MKKRLTKSQWRMVREAIAAEEEGFAEFSVARRRYRTVDCLVREGFLRVVYRGRLSIWVAPTDKLKGVAAFEDWR